jgi:hypothetical protein
MMALAWADPEDHAVQEDTGVVAVEGVTEEADGRLRVIFV